MEGNIVRIKAENYMQGWASLMFREFYSQKDYQTIPKPLNEEKNKGEGQVSCPPMEELRMNSKIQSTRI